MPLDAQTQAVLDSIAASGEPAVYELPIAQARLAQLKAIAAMGGEPGLCNSSQGMWAPRYKFVDRESTCLTAEPGTGGQHCTLQNLANIRASASSRRT